MEPPGRSAAIGVFRVLRRTGVADNWAVVAEAIQTILRREGYPQPYEALKGLNDFSDAYQVAVDQKVPLFRRRNAA